MNEQDKLPIVDPDIARFRDRIAAAYAEHAVSANDYAARRAAAEKVRAPWVRGGPEMARSTDLSPGDGCPPMRLHIPVGGYDIAPREGRPLLLYIHGGGWTVFSIETHDRLMREYAARSGFAVLGPEYSLSPEAPYPQALEEMGHVLDWIRANGAAHGLDTRKLVIGGDSAGANLALGTALRERDAGRRGLSGLLLNYGAFDPRPRESWQRLNGPEYMLADDEMAEFWRNYIGNRTLDEVPYAVPLTADLSGLPPAHFCVPAGDILAEENLELAAAMKDAGVAIDLQIYAAATHSFLEAVSISSLAATALDASARWMRDTLEAA
ncbi:alpha/beta hydrolase [Pacificimonas flava]|uniref:Esterase/lipase n=1 Tax=Pacificimonas flava TaxID=1234595 RepID=M2TS44_9SPHN|nr:alpha/beta hydrolase [Pacificimonas flava]EMD84621.1 Esterase/lipase [Pacificimonas flava]MBB5279511.1 acetyl esterase [Pacificimonas flava]